MTSILKYQVRIMGSLVVMAMILGLASIMAGVANFVGHSQIGEHIENRQSFHPKGETFEPVMLAGALLVPGSTTRKLIICPEYFSDFCTLRMELQASQLFP
eukprot:gene23960-10085_t